MNEYTLSNIELSYPMRQQTSGIRGWLNLTAPFFRYMLNIGFGPIAF